MSKTVVFEVPVTFGDCDPAGIVFFPNYCKWMDASSLNYFMQNGMPPWRELTRTRGIIGTPLLEINTKFMKPSSYGDRLQVYSTITEWREKTFIFKHVVKRGEDVLCEGTEVRCFTIKHPDDPDRIKAIPVPEDIKAMCL